MVHVATQRGRATRLQHRQPPRAQPVAPMRERHCRHPRLTPRCCTAQALSRDRNNPVTHGRRNGPIVSQCHRMRGPPASPLFASWPLASLQLDARRNLLISQHTSRIMRGADSRFMYRARDGPGSTLRSQNSRAGPTDRYSASGADTRRSPRHRASTCARPGRARAP
jgi:hypothetical protein